LFSRFTRTIYRKELKDILRDRRSLVSMTVVPLLLTPVLIIGTTYFVSSQAKKVAEKKSIVRWSGTQAPDLKEQLRSLEDIDLLDGSDDHETIAALLRDKTIDLAIVVSPDFDTQLASRETSDRKPGVTLFFDETRERSNLALRRVSKVCRAFENRILAGILERHGLPPGIVEPVGIVERNVRSKEEMGRYGIGMFLPYLIIMTLLSGAMYPAIDMTAGEKERGTLETLLAAGVPRTDIVLGKFLLVFTAALVTLGLTIASLFFTFSYSVQLAPDMAAEIARRFAFSLDAIAFLQIILALVPLAAIFSALLMTISLFAKSYREAQSYTMPMLIVVLMLSMVSLMPMTEFSTSLAFVPILNSALTLRNAFAGTGEMSLVAITVGVNLLLSAICFYLIFTMFRREEVLFRV